MKTTARTLITIIAEDELEADLIADLKTLGVKGYTISSVRGEGHHGVRGSLWEGENLRIEIIAHAPLAERVATFVAERYFPKYATIVYLTEVQVLRSEKFNAPPNSPA
jgi:nitrogen regulatory protein P-II 2